MTDIRLTSAAKLGKLFCELEMRGDYVMPRTFALNLVSLIIVLVLVIISGL